jgi:membrane protein
MEEHLNMEYVNILWKSIVGFYNHDGPILAGSITCFFMMSIAPFFLLLVAVLGYFLGQNQEFYDFLAARLVDFFPTVTSGVMEELQKIITYRKVDMFTLGIYAYFSYQLYFSFERAVNITFESPGKRSFFKSLLLSLFIAISLIVLLFLFFGFKLALSFMEPLENFFPGLSFGSINPVIMEFILPVVLVLVITSVFYMIVPQKKIMLRHALIGALITTLLIEIGKHIFTYYAIQKISQFGMVYGSLTAVVIFLLWVFYAACIFLIGAEIVRNLENIKNQSVASSSV